jgi:hydroxyacyl-ACP dehydratase HTD2-like protein with hotdog domain
MWAGGSLEFNDANIFQLRLGSREAICTERISDVAVRGKEGDEKVIVTIERIISQIRSMAPTEQIEIEQYLKDRMERDSDYMGEKALVEKRNLVFMRQKTREAAREDARTPGKVVRRMQIQSSTCRFCLP